MANTHLSLDHLSDSAYVNVPHTYTEQLKAIRPELFQSHNHEVYDCHTDLCLDSLVYYFSEFNLKSVDVVETLNFLYTHNIPFLLRQNFTENMYIEYLYLLNPSSKISVLYVESAHHMIEPTKGKLTKLAALARERTRIALPSAGFINNVMKQQMVLFKLTGTIDTLTEFKYEPIKRKTE